MESAENPEGVGDELASIEYHSGPPMLLFTDDEVCRQRIAEAIEVAGGRVSAALTLDQALIRTAEHAAPAGVIVDLGTSADEPAIAILDMLEAGVSLGRFRSVVLIPPELIDLAAARAGHRDIQLLCGADGIDVATALGDLVLPRGMLLNDVSTDTSGPTRLRELSEEVGRIARTLAALSNHRDDSRSSPFGDSEGGSMTDAAVDAPTIRAMIRARRLRDQYFGPEIFADPAWDMLLDLMAARIEGQPVAVSSLCIAAAVPPTTGLRWIKAMTDGGLLVRVADPIDRRRVFIELSTGAADAMAAYLVAARRISPWLN